jgi:phosphoribosylamine--glycine ligase
LITKSCDGIGIAFALQRDGYDVKVHLLDKYYKNIQDGLITKVDSLEEGLKGNPVVIFDQTGSGDLAESIIKRGIRVIGSGGGKFKGKPIMDLIEDSREQAFQLVENLGINTSEWHNFKKGAEAIAFLKGKGKDKRWVAKPNGKLSTALTFPSEDNEELIAFIEKIDKQLKEGLILQEFVEGTEISTEVWVSGGKFIKGSINHTLETKKFLDDNLGPNTGCMSSLVWFAGETNIYKQVLKKLEPFINATNYNGFIDVNTIVDKKGKAYWLEFTPRFGYSAWYAASILVPDAGAVFAKMASGNMTEFTPKKGFGVAIRLTTSPYPFEAPKEAPEGMEKVISGKYEDMLNRLVYAPSKDLDVAMDIFDEKIVPLDVYESDGKIFTAGNEGIVAEALGIGSTIKEAVADAYKTVEKVEFANCQYRTDVLVNAEKRYGEIRGLL